MRVRSTIVPCVLLAGSLLLGCKPAKFSERQFGQGPCDSFELDVQGFWAEGIKAQLETSIAEKTVNTLSERLVKRMDAITRKWISVQSSVCKDTVDQKRLTPEVYAQISACMRMSLASQKTVARVMAGSNKENLYNLDEAIQVIDSRIAGCQNQAIYSAYFPRESDRLAVVAARDGKDGPLSIGAVGSTDLDLAQQALGEVLIYKKAVDRTRWAQVVEQGIAAARRAKASRLLVQLIVSQADMLISLGTKSDEAMRLSSEALTLAEQDKYEEGIAGSQLRIGIAYEALGQNEQALEWYRKALAVREAHFGKDHPETSLSYVAIGGVLAALGKYDDSLESYQKALAVQEKVQGPDHPDTLSTYDKLGRLSVLRERYSEALEWHQKALTSRKKTLGDVHPETANSYTELANLHLAEGKMPRALELYEKSLSVNERALGGEGQIVATACYNLAEGYLRQGKKTDEALRWHQKALSINEKVLGLDHPNTALSYAGMARVLVQQGNSAKAFEWYQKAIVVQEKAFGNFHPITATTYGSMAALYLTIGKVPEAIELFQKAIEAQEKTIGAEHVDVAVQYHNLAILYQKQKKYADALQSYERALGIFEKVLGKSHAKSQNTLEGIRILCKKQRHKPACAFMKQRA